MITTFIARVSLTLLIVGVPLLMVGCYVYFGKSRKFGDLIFLIGVRLTQAGFAIGIVSLLTLLWGA